jgi:hypothetical protein
LKVVADASVLIGLGSIQMLDVLHKRFPKGVLIPPSVWKEVVEQGGGRPGSREVSEADWIKVQEFEEQGIVNLLQAELDEGEVGAIALAYQIGADVILLDERDARQAAQKLGLNVLGTIGVLTWAKQNGVLSSLQTALDELQDRGNFRISRKLYQRVLHLVGEL